MALEALGVGGLIAAEGGLTWSAWAVRGSAYVYLRVVCLRVVCLGVVCLRVVCLRVGCLGVGCLRVCCLRVR